MKRQLMAAVAVCALSFTAGCASTTPQPTERYADGGGPATTPLPQAAAAGATYPATAEGAAAFVADTEAKYAELSEYASRVAWTRATNSTFDTM